MTNADELPTALGKIHVNLQAFEFLLRLFLYESVGPKDAALNFDKLTVGDWVQENPITNYDSLEILVRKVNERLEAIGKPDRVDRSLVDIRDALAHGRSLSSQPTGPFQLLKFSRPIQGKVKVTTALYLTPQWLMDQIKHTNDEVQKIMSVGRSLGLSCFPP